MTDKIYKIRLKKGDTVVVRAGKYKGKTGKITQVLPKENKVIVDGVNIVKKHLKPNRDHPQGAIIELTKPMWVSKLGLIDPATKKPTRVGYSFVKDKKIRVYKSNGRAV